MIEDVNIFPVKGELQIKLVSSGKIFLFWVSSDLPKEIIQLFFNRNFEELIHAARIYDVTDIVFDGKNALHYFEFPLSYDNGHWMIKGLAANRWYMAEIGVKFSERESDFFPLLRSTTFQTHEMDGIFENEILPDLIQWQEYEDRPPKWTESVSTYSFYEDSHSEGEK